jgi:hypothetical protein
MFAVLILFIYPRRIGQLSYPALKDEEWLSFFGLKSATVPLQISKSVSRT